MKLSENQRKRLISSRKYLDFLKFIMDEYSTSRGYKTRLAEVAGCQPAYLSQILAEQVHLTPEQAERLISFWQLDEFESDYFFNLVLLGRAGTLTLKKRLEQKLREIQILWKKNTAEFPQPSITEPMKASFYYSHWLHSALHLLLTIPQLQSAESLSRHLKISLEDVHLILEEMVKFGFAEKTNDKFRPLQTLIHASDQNFVSEVHHKNWRIQALELQHHFPATSVRYTSVHSLSKEDFKKVSAILDEAIQKTRQTIEPSPEEVAACLVIDYFRF